MLPRDFSWSICSSPRFEWGRRSRPWEKPGGRDGGDGKEEGKISEMRRVLWTVEWSPKNLKIDPDERLYISSNE